MYKKIFITGGCGCIGIAVANKLIARGVEVVVYDLWGRSATRLDSLPGVVTKYGSILDADSLSLCMNGCDAVIHLAAHLGVKRTEEDPLRCLEVNIQGTKNVLEASRKHRVKKFIFASSSEVYGEPIEERVTELSMTQGKTIYAVSKLAGEELVKAFAKIDSSFDHTILRFFNTYGPHQISQFVVPRFITQALSSLDITVNGNGEQTRSYSYASDTAEGVVLSLYSDKSRGEVFNIGNDKEPISVRDLAALIRKVTKSDSRIVYEKEFDASDRDANREIHHRHGSMGKAKKILGYEPKVSLIEGIKLVVDSGELPAYWPQ